jgi:beta-glucanase (GH16 family)
MLRKTIIFAMFSCLCLSSCGSKKSDEPVNPKTQVTITVSPQSLTVGNVAGTTNVTVTANADWSIKSDADWCTVFPTGGVKDSPTNVTLTYGALNDIDSRQATLTVSSGGTVRDIVLTQSPASTVILNTSMLTAGALAQNLTFVVSSNTQWTISGAPAWCSVAPASGGAGSTAVTVSVSANASNETRKAELSVNYSGGSKSVTLTQLSDVINTPAGYTLVWNDEFNDKSITTPDEKQWWYETGNGGWGNNEIQNYVAGKKGSTVVAQVSDGTLKIKAVKVGGEVLSARVNTVQSWTYGYFEARLKLPKGKGTWPAFWMMPKVYTTWPDCGEIDIMEEVGYNPNYTSSSIHCSAYNHSIGTQKTAERLTAGAQDEFHVYALEWTEDYIKTYVDGVQLLSFVNDKKGNDKTWPFNKAFYLKLNLAWGGNWGGAQGVDESALPATYEIDYVRVFQKQ